MLIQPAYLQALCLIILSIFYSPISKGQSSTTPFDNCLVIQEPGYGKTLAKYKSLKNNDSVEDDTIGIYFEIDYALYNQLNSSEAASLDYLNDLFQNVRQIYAMEGISLKISGVKVWDIPDPYDKRSAHHALLSFGSRLDNTYSGHLAHLLSGNTAKYGGLAYLSGLCDRNKSYAYSNVYGEVGGLDHYSWDTHVVAHEIGHNLGSPHTNDCFWGPDNDTALDGCGQTSTDCSLASIPQEGGTIMSSCHANPVGVNLELGLGTEPGAIIRSVIASCYLTEGGSCNNPIYIQEAKTYTVNSITSGNGALQSGAEHSIWYLFIAQKNGFINVGSCAGGVDTRIHIYRGQCSDLSLESSNDDQCHSGEGYFFASYIDSIEVILGDSLWIEWDDRWSSDGFDWQLDFFYSEPETCYNGILDIGEDDIDCGPYCQPCSSPCESYEALTIDHDGSYYSDTTMMMNSMIYPNTNISLSTPHEVIFEQGSEISTNAILEIYVEDCDTYQSRITDN